MGFRMLQFQGKHETILLLVVVHKRAYNNHIGGKTLAHKLLRAGYYWPTLMKDNITFVKKCDQCQRHADLHHAPTELRQLMTFSRPFINEAQTSRVCSHWCQVT